MGDDIIKVCAGMVMLYYAFEYARIH